jgi:hypothetical protein
MGRISSLTAAALLLIVTFGCSGTKHETVMLPPRIDLTQHDTIGVIDFTTTSKGKLGPLTTQRFTDLARRDQGLVRIIEFGSESEALSSVGESDISTETLKSLGKKHGVRTIITGELTVSEVKPDIQIHSWTSGSLSGKVNATLAVELIETDTGASIWSTSARSTQSVGHIRVFKGGIFSFDADDPEKAYGELVDSLVAQVTRDFRVRYEQRLVE